MPGGKGIYDDEGTDEPKGGRPGPTDEGGEGVMATRENTPDVAEPARSQLDFRVAVQGGVERDIVAAGVEVTKRQTGQRQNAARTCGLLDIEFHST